jgi:outer membrane protein TolC
VNYPKKSFVRQAQSLAAILVLQVNLALAVEPVAGGTAPRAAAPAAGQASAPAAAQAAAPVAPADGQAAQQAPEAPPPPASQTAAPPSIGQQFQQAQQQNLAPQVPFYVAMPHSHNPLAPYRPSHAPEFNLANSPRLANLIRDGKVYISLRDAISLAIENNLDLAYFRYNFPIAQTDLLRTKSGAVANGVSTGTVQGTQGGFFSSGGGGGGGGGVGVSAVGSGGLVTSVLGAGAPVASFDPMLQFTGDVDHTVTQEVNAFLVGTPTLRTNTIKGQAQFSQSFPSGMTVSAAYTGERVASNSPDNAINPELFSNLEIEFSQNLLAGFGFASNERYIHLAKRNLQLTDLAFRLQVITTVTQIENIYWDLESAYQDEQIKERSLGFANQTLTDDQKQLELQAIPAMQVMKDQSDVAAAEGLLTVSRTSLRLQELQMLGAVTKTDDPVMDTMSVIPLDRAGPPDPNAGKSIDDLIAEAEKNRPDVAELQVGAEIQRQGVKDINSELLPTLDMYGFYAGNGTAGPSNPNCNVALLGPECTSTLPTGFPGMFSNTFNYSAPEYQVGLQLTINLRNRQVKADQFRAVLQYRQSQIQYEQSKKNIIFGVRNAAFALEQAKAEVDAAQKACDLAQKTFDITAQEQQLGAKSRVDTLAAEVELATAQSALVAAQALYEKNKIQVDLVTGDTLQRMNVSIEDAKSGVVTRAP